MIDITFNFHADSFGKDPDARAFLLYLGIFVAILTSFYYKI